MGQPLHSFDADHIAGKHVIVKTLADGATFASLDGNERVLADEDLMICDGDSKGMCIAGVFGGIGSGVTESTTNVFLESAHFHPVWIRKTSTRHLLRTDAARCFEKTTDPNVCVAALKRAASLIRDLAGGQIASEVIDIYPKKIEPRKVHLSYNHIDRLIGIQMDREKIQEILDAMRIRIVNETDEKLVVAVPTNKADVTREADVIEEILRIYGFNNVPLKPKMENTISYVDRPSHYQVRQILGSFLSSIGFSEMMALSMNPSEYYNERMAIPDGKELVYINNTSNISLDVMRAEMLSSALDAVVYNQNRQSSDIKLFEFGKSYLRNEDQYIEREHITLVIAGSQVPENWLANKGKPATFFSIKKFVDALITRVGIRGYRIENLKDDSDFDYGRMYRMGPDVLVRYGKVSNAILSGFNIRGEVYFADFNFEMLYQFFKRGTISVQEISRYPTVRRDLALLLDKNVGFEEVVKVARQTERNILQLVDLFDVYENEEQLGAGKKSYAVKFIFENMERTLTDAEVDQVMDKLMKAYQSKLGAELR
jgi:phenylalanyl-tRNA synthetase beta chain